MKNVKIISITLILLVSAYVVAQNSEMPEITIGDLVEWMANEEEITILDVRTQEELVGELGHIKGVINIPVQELEKRVEELEKYKEQKIAVICRSGNRSKQGTSILLQNGYDAYNVQGGMRAYRKVIVK